MPLSMLKTEFNHQTLMVRKENGRYREATRTEIFNATKRELDSMFSRESHLLESPGAVKDWLRTRLAPYTHEVFGVLWLDNRHRAITFAEYSHGTIDSAAVSPREIVRGAIEHNAGACILAHNHPSGVAAPSSADKEITKKLKGALELVGTRTIDHIIVAESTYSFAEHGMI